MTGFINWLGELVLISAITLGGIAGGFVVTFGIGWTIAQLVSQ